MDVIRTDVPETMTLKEITDLLEVRHNDAMNVVEKMLDNQDFGHATKISYRTSRGNEYETYQLNKRQSIAVAAKLNTSLLMRIIDRWQELENRQQQQLPSTEKLRMEAILVETFAKVCNVSESGRLGVLHRLASNYGLNTNFLPAYTVDGPTGHATVGSSEVTHSATALLKKRGLTISTVRFNKELFNAGILEKGKRKNSRGEDKSFWVISDAGLEYGKNVTHPDNPREVAPHWYDEKFDDLLTLLSL